MTTIFKEMEVRCLLIKFFQGFCTVKSAPGFHFCFPSLNSFHTGYVHVLEHCYYAHLSKLIDCIFKNLTLTINEHI